MKKKISLFLLFVMSVFLTACSPDVIRLTEMDNGKKITCSPEDTIIIELPGNPTTGYTWMQERVPSDSVLVLSREVFVQLKKDRNLVGAPGVSHFEYVVSGKGEEGIKLIYHRRWETNKQPIGKFEVLVHSK